MERYVWIDGHKWKLVRLKAEAIMCILPLNSIVLGLHKTSWSLAKELYTFGFYLNILWKKQCIHFMIKENNGIIQEKSRNLQFSNDSSFKIKHISHINSQSLSN